MAKLPVQTTPVLNKDGTMSDAWYRALSNIVSGAGSDSIKSIVSGANERYQQIDRIVAGTEPVADVLINGRGNVTDALDANTENITEVAGAGTVLAVTTTPNYASGSRAGAGSVTTAAISFDVSNGTGPYTAAFTKISGSTFTPNTTSFTGANLTSTFSTTIAAEAINNATYKITVTDTSDSSTTAFVFYLSAYDTNGISI